MVGIINNSMCDHLIGFCSGMCNYDEYLQLQELLVRRLCLLETLQVVIWSSQPP